MWLSNSSVGRKVVMSVTGIALILFLTFHMAMNLVALVSANGYNMVCEFLGANWYALVATVGLAALFIIHIIYAFWLTMQNRKARGNERYAVVDKPCIECNLAQRRKTDSQSGCDNTSIKHVNAKGSSATYWKIKHNC